MSEFTVGVPRDAGELDALASILVQVYSISEGLPYAQRWFERAGQRNLRVLLRGGGSVAGGLLVMPLGQWFGGRPVPMAGIAAVAVAPEHRGGGAGTALMRGTLAGLRADGFPLSALYPATQTLYRRAGYERAGLELHHALPAKAIDVRERDGTVRRATEADAPAIVACCRRRAAATNGNLERSDYVWTRVRDGRPGVAHGYVVDEGGEVTGYVYYVHRQAPDGTPDLWCTDLAATTPRAARRLLGFLADHRSLAGKVGWRGAPNDPLLAQLPEQRDATTSVHSVWMLRILDVPAAMTARGWSSGVSAEVHLDVADDLFEDNAGRWVLRVEAGGATCERGGRGDLRIDVRGLAALYSSWAGPGDLVASGLAEGPESAIAAAACAFAGPVPWMADHF
jgi:predicted acetyltransferase